MIAAFILLFATANYDRSYIVSRKPKNKGNEKNPPDNGIEKNDRRFHLRHSISISANNSQRRTSIKRVITRGSCEACEVTYSRTRHAFAISLHIFACICVEVCDKSHGAITCDS